MLVPTAQAAGVGELEEIDQLIEEMVDGEITELPAAAMPETQEYDASDDVNLVDSPSTEDYTLHLNAEESISLSKGETFQLTASLLPSNTTSDSATIQWTSSDDEIASVSNTGVVTALTEGIATIEVTTEYATTSVLIIVQPAMQLFQANLLATSLEEKSGLLWSKAENLATLTNDRVLAFWQSGYVDTESLKHKAQPSTIQGETISNYINATMLLAASQSNPFAYEGKNYAEKLVNAQTSAGYFSFSEPNSYNNDSKADIFVKALFAVEFIGADYNRQTALAHLKTVVPDLKSTTNGINLGLAVSVLTNYTDAEAVELREELLTHYKESKVYFASGLGLYVDNLLALGENPLDEKWFIKITDDVSISMQEVYENLIHTNTNYAFFNRLKAGDKVGQSSESVTSSTWSLIGLSSLVNGKSMIQDARQQFQSLDFDFSPKTIDATNVGQPFLVAGTIFKPIFSVKDQYNTPRAAIIHLQSSNPAVLAINEKNELVAKEAGHAVVTATVEGYPNVRIVLPFLVTEDAQLSKLLPKIEKAFGHLTQQDKLDSFEEATALKIMGYDEAKIAKTINIYSIQSPFNAAKNILSLTAAGLDPYTYNGKDYVAELHSQIERATSIDSGHAAHIILAQYILGEELDSKVMAALVNELVIKDNAAYIETINAPDINRTSKVWQAITLINTEKLATENAAQFADLEQKIFDFFKANFTEDEKNAVAILNYLSLKQQQELEGFNTHTLATIILKNQWNNTFITNGHIPGLSGLQSESTGIGLNALSYLLTGKNAYTHLKVKEVSKPTTIELQLPNKVKENMPFDLQGQILDQNGTVIDTVITWLINGSPVASPFTPTEAGILQIRAEAEGIIAEKRVEVIDYQKVFKLTINPIIKAVTDEDYALTATIIDSEEKEITDAIIMWKVEGPNAIVNGSALRFLTPGLYTITAEAEGTKARAVELQVDLNTASIQTRVAQAVEQMKQYLEQRGQYDYISALAYSKVVNNSEFSQKKMRSVGHLREYGNHDKKYALYYAKNILQAVAASENPKQFTTYKGAVVDLVTPLIQSQDTDGHFTMFENFDKYSVSTQIWSIIALDLIQEPYEVELAIKDLLKGLNSPSIEGSYKEQELRAIALIALSKHRDIEGVNQQITAITNYLKSQQNDEAGFNYGGYTNSPFAIGSIIQGLVAVGENPYDAKWKKNGRTMVEALLSQQIKNGGFKFGDEFSGEYVFDELKSTEAAFGALADLYAKMSIFNEASQIIEELPEINKEMKPYIEIDDLQLQEDQPLLSVSVSAFDNIDGELTPIVTLNDTAVYSVNHTYKAIVKQGVNSLQVTTVNSQGNQAVETIPILFQHTTTKMVPQATVKVAGVNGTSIYSNKAIIENGDTAYTALVKAIGKHNIVSRPYSKGVYIVSINNLAEFDYGEGSGWMYRVNGVFPNVYAGEIHLQDGDVLEWLYTTNLGKDIGTTMPDTPTNTPPAGAGGTAPNEGNDDDKKEPVNNNGNITIIEMESNNGTTETIFTKEDIENHTENQSEAIVIQDEKGNKLEIPISSLATLQLAEGEKVVASITTHPVSKQFTVNFGIETAQGRIRSISLGKDYLKATLPADDVKPDTVVLQLVRGEYKPVPHKIANGEIVLFTKTSGTFIVTEKHVTFKDIEKLANKDEIEFLASRLVIQGVTSDTFEPNKPITRAQFAALISRSLGLQTSGENPFSDTAGKWYANDVQALYEAGITKGTTTSTFNPEAPITRQQAAAFMARILENLNIEAQVTGEANFKDVGKISAEYLPYTELLNSLDIMTGKQDGSFDPGASLTRVQTVKILKRTLNIAGMM